MALLLVAFWPMTEQSKDYFHPRVSSDGSVYARVPTGEGGAVTPAALLRPQLDL